MAMLASHRVSSRRAALVALCLTFTSCTSLRTGLGQSDAPSASSGGQTSAAQQTSGAQPAAEPAEAAAAQDAAEQPAPEFQTLLAQWKGVESQLANLVRNYRESFSNKEREAILTEYRRLTAESREILPALRRAAIAEYQAQPNGSQEVTQILIGLLANDLRNDRLDDAAEIGQLLEQHKCDAQALPGLLGMLAYHRDEFDRAQALFEAAKAGGTMPQEAAIYLEDLPTARQAWQQEQQIREREAQADDLPRVRLTTSQGEILLELFENEAPDTVGNFISLVESGFYEGSPFHRVLPNFMAQGGAKSEDGQGGPGYEIYCECTRADHRKHFRGSLSMAKKSEPNTGSSQFFLTFRRTSHLDGKHTVFGRVLEGWDVLHQLERRDPTQPGQPEPDVIVKAEVVRKRDHAYAPNKVADR